MAILPILPITDPRLRLPSEAVDPADPALPGLVGDMVETMIAAQGAGLAAVQVGVLKRLLVTDVADGEPPRALINPELVAEAEERVETEEGCLSMPGLYFGVLRPRWLRVRYRELGGAVRMIEAEGFEAVCLHHEIDHLNGVRAIDRVSRVRRERLLARHRKLERLAR
jgi:peptide deformylase